jgi:hypothetical protein
LLAILLYSRTVVGISCEAQTALFKLFVQFVEIPAHERE